MCLFTLAQMFHARTTGGASIFGVMVGGYEYERVVPSQERYCGFMKGNLQRGFEGGCIEQCICETKRRQANRAPNMNANVRFDVPCATFGTRRPPPRWWHHRRTCYARGSCSRCGPWGQQPCAGVGGPHEETCFLVYEQGLRGNGR